jgi:uncharacterized glyoxalase superfamily protein PhnB
MAANTLHAATPILRIFDEAKAREFYIDFLGFTVDWEHRFEPSLPLYMQVVRNDCVLHLSEHHGDACPGAALRIAVDDVDALASELLALHASHTRPQVQDMPWGTRDMGVTDPFGNRLVFFSDIAAPT